MIPENLMRFLETSGVAIAGTRDENMVPRLHRASGWQLESDGETLACLIPENYVPQLLPNLEDNGQFALTVCEIASHETYQFKCEYIDSRAVTQEDKTVFQALRSRFAEAIGHIVPSAPKALTKASVNEPALVIRSKIREVFVQTPGPGAGTRTFPAEDK